MSTFSTSEALGAGFNLIGRKPLAVLAWGLALLLLGVAPMAGLMALVLPDMINFFQQATANALTHPGVPPDPATFLPFEARMMMFQPVILLSSVVSRAVLMGAVFRAVLEPKNDRFAYLRLGTRELWLGLLYLVLSILAAILMVAIIMACAIIGVIVGLTLHASGAAPGWIALAILPLVVAAMVVFIAVAVRFSLAPVMTYAENEFRLFESWNLTKGHAWKLFGLAFLLSLIVGVIAMVVQTVFFGGMFAVVGMSGFDTTQLQALLRQPPQVWMQAAAPWLAVAAVVICFLGAGFMAIFLAPWAVVYQQLTAAPPAPAAA